jgi:hypothetical protein
MSVTLPHVIIPCHPKPSTHFHFHISTQSLISHLVLIFCFLIADQNGMMGTMMQDLAFAIPGVDEAMSFAEIMKCVRLGSSISSYSVNRLRRGGGPSSFHFIPIHFHPSIHHP